MVQYLQSQNHKRDTNIEEIFSIWQGAFPSNQRGAALVDRIEMVQYFQSQNNKINTNI